MKYIVTHGGQAHRDDFLAVSLALAIEGRLCPVHRREPTQGELENESILVLDVGGRHEPLKNNFDHHQDRSLDCAFVLYGREHINLSNCEWVKPLNIGDTQGPMKLAEFFGMERLPRGMHSPIENSLLSLFSREETVRHSLLEMMYEIGNETIEFIECMNTAIKELDSVTETHEVGGIKVLVTECVLHSGQTQAMSIWKERHAADAAIQISWDDRGPGWSIFRYDDHPGINLSKLEGHEAITFAHKNGFIAKTKQRLAKAEVLNLITRALE